MIDKAQFVSQHLLDTLPLQLAEVAEKFVLVLTQTVRETAKIEWDRLEAAKEHLTSASQVAPQTVEQVAEMFDVTTQTVRAWDKEGRLSSYRLGGRIYFKYAEVLAALQARNTPDGRRKYARRQYQRKAR